jgi:hypothetical protein
MCSASSQQKSAADKLNTLTGSIMGQVSQVFGSDQSVFNNLMSANQGIVQGGPGQQGFTQAEVNAMNSQVINNNAAQFKNVAGVAKTAQSVGGGGNTALASGANTAQNEGIAEAAAANTAAGLNQVTQADYATGRQNFWEAQKGEQAAGQSFNNLPGIDTAATGAANQNLQAQTQIGNAANWWQKPVMGLVGAGLNLASGGVGGVAGSALDIGSNIASNAAGE